ncbi:MAG: hypothetical protein O3B41_10075 [Bacteroidetes bacterium]|nr:hypothetical protein [Bacteroidota bacterium]
MFSKVNVVQLLKNANDWRIHPLMGTMPRLRACDCDCLAGMSGLVPSLSDRMPQMTFLFTQALRLYTPDYA